MVLPKNAINRYETLRKQVLEGAIRPQGLCVIIHHGMLRGLQIVTDEFTEIQADSTQRQQVPLHSVPLNAELVHLLANLILSLHLEARHVH